MGDLIKGVHHIAIKCKDEEQFNVSVIFYTQCLGLKVVRSWGSGKDEGIMIQAGASMFEIFASGAVSDSTGSINHIALETDDVDGCIRRCREFGCKITVEPADIVIGSIPPYPARMGFAIGPAGEEIEFFKVR